MYRKSSEALNIRFRLVESRWTSDSGWWTCMLHPDSLRQQVWLHQRRIKIRMLVHTPALLGAHTSL